MKQLLRYSVFTLALVTSAFLLAQNTGSPAGTGGAAPSGDYGSTAATQSGGTAQTAPAKAANGVDDQKIHQQVHDQLSTNPDLQNVQIAVENGRVTLTGTVPNKNDKKEAKRITSSVPGVKKVKENLSVSNPGGTSSAAATSMGTPTGNQPADQENGPSPRPDAANPNSPQGPSAPQEPGATPPRMENNFLPQSSSNSSQNPNSNSDASQQTTPQTTTPDTTGPNTNNPDTTQAPGNTSPGAVGSNADPEMTKHPDQNSNEQSAPMSEQPNTPPPSTTPGTAPDQTPTPPPQTSAPEPNPPHLMTVAYQASGSGQPRSSTSNPGSGTPSSVGSQAGSAESTSGIESATGTTGSGSAAAGTTASGATPAHADPVSSDQVKSNIQSAYKNDPDLSNATITIGVTDQAVQLSGAVPTSRDKDMARKIAESFSGSRTVVDSLTVSSGQASAGSPGAVGSNAGASTESNTGAAPSSTTSAPASPGNASSPESASPNSGATTTTPPQI